MAHQNGETNLLTEKILSLISLKSTESKLTLR